MDAKLPPVATRSTEDMAIDEMLGTPKRGTLHRRAHSDTSFRFPNLDDLLLFDPSDLDLSALPSPSPSPSPTPSAAPPTHLDPSPLSSDESSGGRPFSRIAGAASSRPSAVASHVRSLSVDSDFFDGLGFGGGDSTVGEKRASIDGFSVGTSFEANIGLDGIKKAMAPDRLAELALIDPKRAKRILANRQSAARSKERKIRYTNELEKKVQTLQTEATTLSAQVTILQRDTTGLTSENKELKLRLQAIEQQAELREALNEKLKEEVQRLKIASGQIQTINGNPFGRGPPPPPFAPQQPIRRHFGTHQTQQQQQQLSMPQPSSNNGQPSQLSFMDFNQRV